MPKANLQLFFSLLLLFSGLNLGYGRAERLRCMWRSDPSTTMVIGWDQVSGGNPRVFYGTEKGGRNISRYPNVHPVDRVVVAKGQNNYFARLTGLKPNTVYYFLIRDSEGSTGPFSFRTAPDSPTERLSIIAGGDSRNFREARQRANRLVAKLRPHFVLFAGDMTGGDTDREWIEWLDDWQLTTTEDQRLTPIVPARGNHEYSNQTLVNLFDLPGPDNYYGLSFGGRLLRVITLNSSIPSQGKQREWLEKELETHRNAYWKIAQYHHPIRPHTIGKRENDHLYAHWAPLFFQYGLDLAVECDAHVVKLTWPVRPSWEPGSDEGFIRDDLRGTVYVGEGGWGAPLRPANDEKTWTRAMGSFNHLKWIFVDAFQLEIRVLPTDQEELVGALDPGERFQVPEDLKAWTMQDGKLVRLLRRHQSPVLAGMLPGTGALGQTSLSGDVVNSLSLSQLEASPYGKGIRLQWVTRNEVEGTTYAVQRRLEDELRFTTLHTFNGYAGAANLHQYIDTDLDRAPINSWVEYRINGMLPNGIVKMYNLRSQRQAQARLQPALPQLQFLPGTRKVRIPFLLREPAKVKTIFVDEQQKEVLRIFFQDLGPGKHVKEVDLSNLPKGTYQVRLEARAQKLESFFLDNQ